MARHVSPNWINRVRNTAMAAGLRAPQHQWFTIAVLMKWRLGKRYLSTDEYALRDALKGFAATYQLDEDVPEGIDIFSITDGSETRE